MNRGKNNGEFYRTIAEEIANSWNKIVNFLNCSKKKS